MRFNRGATRWVGKGGNGAAQHTDFDYPTREGKGGHSRCSAPPLRITLRNGLCPCDFQPKGGMLPLPRKRGDGKNGAAYGFR